MFIYMQFFFSDNLLDLSDHVVDHALNWKKYDHSSYKMKTYYKTDSCLFFQNLYPTWVYVALNEDSENVLFFCNYFLFCLVPVPLQCINVVIATKK